MVNTAMKASNFNMNRFATQKPWVKGGVVGVGVCAVIFMFYVLIYFPIISTIDSNHVASRALIPPVVTGHALPILAHFALEGSALPKALCEQIETRCVHWALEYEDGAVPWDGADGGTGYCRQQETVPAAACTERIEAATTVLSIGLLGGAYFLIGAATATIIARHKKLSSST